MTSKEVLGSVSAQKFRSPAPANEGNWKSSQLFCQTLADAIKTYGSDDLPANFPAVIEPYLNNIIECALSERTQLSVQGCRLLGELPKALGKDIHPLLDRLLPALIKHCASTKTVNQKSASSAISNIVVYSTYNSRLLWHVTQAFEDKNVGPRIYAPSWLQLILDNYVKALHPDRDFDAIAQAITNGLLDADLTVRTNNRSVFWAYHKLDPAGAGNIKAQLNNFARTALDNDPNNPEKKVAKSKPKKSVEPDPALAQIRLQAKKRMQERMQERNRNITPQTITSADFPFGAIEIDNEKVEDDLRVKKPVRDAQVPPTGKIVATPSQPDPQSVSKVAARSAAVHKKGLSHDGQILQVGKKASSTDLGGSLAQKKPLSAEGLRTSQNQKPTNATTEPQGARHLLSAPVRRPRILATPINVAQPSSRPSSRTGHSHSNSQSNETNNNKSTREAAPLHTPQESKSVSSNSSVPTEVAQSMKISKKISRPQIASPVLIPDGKENATIFATKTASSKAERIPSPTRRPLGAPQSTEASRRDFTQTTTEVHPDTDISDARRAFKTGLRLLQADQMDYMGFRKLKKLVCNYGHEMVTEHHQYDTLIGELLPKLGTMDEVINKGDTRDMKHPTYIRQAVLHMVFKLLSEDFPALWREPYLGAALCACVLARCCYTPNTRENLDPRQTHSPSPNSTVDLLTEAIEKIIGMGRQPLDLLSVVVDCMRATEAFLVEHSDELPDPNSSAEFASFDRYRVREKDYFAQQGIDPPPRRGEETGDGSRPRVPSTLPFFMETSLKVVTRLLEKARKLEHALSNSLEEQLADLASHLLSAYNVLIRHQVMLFCKQLYLTFSSHDKFWENFTQEGDKNLLHYYLADAKR